jgi:hypothetical protein
MQKIIPWVNICKASMPLSIVKYGSHLSVTENIKIKSCNTFFAEKIYKI